MPEEPEIDADQLNERTMRNFEREGGALREHYAALEFFHSYFCHALGDRPRSLMISAELGVKVHAQVLRVDGFHQPSHHREPGPQE